MDDTLKAQLPYTLREADFPGLGQLYRGKVRDNYSKGDRIVMITTDRLSAFDRVLTTVPFKGELLNRLTTFWFEKTKDVAPNHILDVPDPSVLVVRKLQPLAVEMVVRGYLTGSLWRDYQAGKGASPRPGGGRWTRTWRRRSTGSAIPSCSASSARSRPGTRSRPG